MCKLQVGTKVKVVQDLEDPESGWVGALGVVSQYNAFDNDYTINVTAGNMNPEGGDFAWFSREELEIQES